MLNKSYPHIEWYLTGTTIPAFINPLIKNKRAEMGHCVNIPSHKNMFPRWIFFLTGTCAELDYQVEKGTMLSCLELFNHWKKKKNTSFPQDYNFVWECEKSILEFLFKSKNLLTCCYDLKFHQVIWCWKIAKALFNCYWDGRWGASLTPWTNIGNM